MHSILTADEKRFVREMAELRLMAKNLRGEKNKRVSNHNDTKIIEMGIAGEFAVAKALGAMFDPFVRRGGDRHRRDLWRGSTTISVKTRHHHLPAHFIYPTNQVPDTFHDDYAVIGIWQHPYDILRLHGYCTREDMNRYVTTIPVSGTRSGLVEQRVGVPSYRFRPIRELARILSEVPDETVSLAQAQGYVGYFRDRLGSGGSEINQRTVYPALAD